MKRSVSLVLIALLAACNSDKDGGTGSSIIVTQNPGDGTDGPITGGSTTGDYPYPWNRYFVTEFDEIKVQRIRDLPGFIANNFRFRLQLKDHPTYGGRGEYVESNPLAAARLDYALSTGLSGAGQIVSMIDSGIRITHEQFAGKKIYTSGGAMPGGDFHGTAVASVMAGTGTNGGTLGFAPGADIHQGYLDFDSSLSWAALGGYMTDAASLGAIVSNNSWGLSDLTVKDQNVAAYFQHSGRKPYVDGLREFATGGVIVFALQNDYLADSASLIAALPLGIPELESNWISVVNAIPTFNDTRIESAERISTACLETARFCMTANGQIMAASETRDDSYQIAVGASFAAPQVSGSIALLAEAFPDLAASQLRDRLLATADNSFFKHTDSLTFAPGIAHGYNTEFGHGFLNLRAALLPIGQAEIPMANGQSLDLGTAAITSGSATGDGLARSLASMSVVSTDQLYGSFNLSADVLAGATGRADPALTALSAAIRPAMATNRSNLNAAIRSGANLAGHQGAWTDPTGAEILGGAHVQLTAADSPLGLAVMTGEATTGIFLHQTFDLAGGSLQVGVATMRTDGSIMGVSVPRYSGEVTSLTNALHIDFASTIATNTALRFNAETGYANGDGAGMVRDFSTISYNRVGFTVERADVGQTGDVLAVFARRPLGITRGSADMDLPVQFATGETSFATRRVSLAPVERQLDLGFEYSAPISRSGNLTLGMMHSDNDGNVAGRRAMSGFVGVQFSF
ncbi:S8 family peptidase [Yoonia sp.]|uniref:S8 family peptidase n=1 Tax=Yoonia sp. TaxID=2212373 RepID=UPI00391C4156